MKNKLRNMILALVAMASLHAVAATTPSDTIYFYDTWEQMLNVSPVAMIIDPYLEVYTPYEIFINTGDVNVDELIMKEHIAISFGDSIWFMSSTYLKQNFKGDVKNLDGYNPVYFNDKVAYIVFHSKLSVKDILFGQSIGDDDEYIYNVDNYYIDFINHRVERVTPSYLSQLLEDYHDLQMRYEGMKDYKKRDIIEDYFFKYIDRATQDFMRPFIVDLVESDSSPIN